MIGSCLVLGALAPIAKDAIEIEFLKSQNRELSQEEKDEILNNSDRRFLHFTSEKSAKEIMKAGFFIPTSGIIDNHFTKNIDEKGRKKNSDMVYMFDSAELSIEDYIKNLPNKRSPYAGVYEYYAISMAPNEYNINSFRKRAQDGAITYDGRLDLAGTDTKLSKFVLDLDKENNYTFREVSLNDEYIPSEELLNKLKSDKRLGSLGFTMKSYALEVKKARESMKTYRATKQVYKDQIKQKRDFAKANKQFINEEKDKNYIYEKDGKTVVVKNLGYEMVDGQKLQKISILGNGFDDKEKNIADISKVCYMDEWNIEGMDMQVATEYFFNNYEDMLAYNKEQEYIGLPLQNLETGDIENEYNEKFKNHFLRKKYQDERAKEYIKENNIQMKKTPFSAIKKFWGNIVNRFSKEKTKMLPEAKDEDKEKLAGLGYSSVAEMNAYDPDIEILQENQIFGELQSQTYPPEEIVANQDIRESEEVRKIEEPNKNNQEYIG